ncbi:vesicle-associated protein 1-1-like protein [Tanacetum coccineum]
MQPQSVPPRDFICKDKFLIQSTIVPKGTKEEHITSSMFAKEDGKLVEEKKLKVILLSPFNSPVLSPMNAISRMRPSYTTTDSEDHWVENNSFHAKVDEETEVYRRDSGLLQATKYEHSISTTHTDDLKFSKDLEEMKSRLKELESLHRQENLRTDQNIRTTVIGFQVLFVSVVALVSFCLGYMLHS